MPTEPKKYSSPALTPSGVKEAKIEQVKIVPVIEPESTQSDSEKITKLIKEIRELIREIESIKNSESAILAKGKLLGAIQKLEKLN